MKTRPLTFTDGVGVGIGLIAMLPVLYLATASGQFAAMYRDMGNAALPATARVVLSPAWRIGIPALLGACWVTVLVWRPHRYWTLGVAATTFAAAAVWYYGLYTPIFALAGNISS